MADNVDITPGTGATVSTEEVTTLNGGAVSAQHIQRVAAAVRTGDGTAVDLPGSTADGLLVNLGANNDVTVAGVATAANQTTMIGHLDGVEGLLGTIDADTGTLAGAVSGTEMQVDVVAALPAGDNNIGNVDVLTVPADPFGANADAASATGSISAKLRQIAATGVAVTALPASTNTLEVVGDAAHDAAAAGAPELADLAVTLTELDAMTGAFTDPSAMTATFTELPGWSGAFTEVD